MKCHGAAGRSLVILLIRKAGLMTRDGLKEFLAAMPERPFAAEIAFDEVIDRMLEEGILEAKDGCLAVTSHGQDVLTALLAKQTSHALRLIRLRGRDTGP